MLSKIVKSLFLLNLLLGTFVFTSSDQVVSEIAILERLGCDRDEVLCVIEQNFESGDEFIGSCIEYFINLGASFLYSIMMFAAERNDSHLKTYNREKYGAKWFWRDMGAEMKLDEMRANKSE